MLAMVDVLFEFLVGLLLIAIGFALGSVVFVVVRGARWALLRAERGTTVIDPSGRKWLVRIPFAPSSMRFWTARWLFRMRHIDQQRRTRRGAAPDEVVSWEYAHPAHLVDETEEAAGCVAIGMLIFFAVALVVLLVEAILLALVAIGAAAVRLSWGRWKCEVVAPDGGSTVVNAGSLGDARALAVVLRESVEKDGNVDAWSQ